MWTLVSIALLLVSFSKGDISMLQVSGIFAIAATIDHIAYQIKNFKFK